jgi:predicted SAM-dependent methyltransferase
MKPFEAFFYIKGELTDHYTKNGVCPICGSLMRHRFVITFLKNNTNLFDSKIKLLHFAPEPWISNLLKKQKNIEYIRCDICPSNYEGAIKVDITETQFLDDRFDVVIAIHVLEHIANDIKAIKELYRIIKPGGWALIAIPTYGEKTYEDNKLDHKAREKMYGMGDHMRMNGLDFKLKLSDAGFEVDIYSIDDVPGNYIDRTASSPNVESDKYLFYCQKRS